MTKSTDKLICLRIVYCNGLKYHKIRYKSRGNNPIKPFRFQFTCVQPVFLYFFYKQIMVSGNVPPQRSKVVVRGDGNRSYRAIALWRDEMSDEKHEVMGRLIEQNPKVFQPLLFSSNSMKEHHKKSKITGTWAETVDIFSCTTRPICTFSTSQENWFTSKQIMITDPCSSVTTKKQCIFLSKY